MTLGERIQKSRHVKKMTARELADAAGLAAWVISEFEMGIRPPSIQQVKRLADALGTDRAWLAWGEPT